MFALSVSISTSSSPTATSSPCDLIHRRIVPSSIESESLGMTISLATFSSQTAFERRHGRADHVLGVGDGRLLEALCVRHWNVGTSDPLDRCVEVVEGLLLDEGREVRADAAMRPPLLQDHAAVRLAHRGENRVEVERAQG